MVPSAAPIRSAVFAALALACGYGGDARAADLVDLSLEQLSNIEVTSVSRRAERLGDAPASVYVITNDDIRRAGARTLPEALRLAPNLQVARTGASGYAISARGFNNDSGLANKLLVLIDGRTVYNLALSGVFWEMQDVMLEDVERIEVVSGPGGTLWGTNAVNGVINVITRSAGDTQGALAAAGGGNRDHGGVFRYGGKLGDQGRWRAYAKSYELENTRLANGNSQPDGWERTQGGFRVDWGDAARKLTVQGDTYTARSEDRAGVGPLEVSGMNVLARWSQLFAGGSDIRLQVYYDRSDREDRVVFRDEIEFFDVEFQHGIPLGSHKVLWGAGYRYAQDNAQNSLFFGFAPTRRHLDWTNLFLQDEIRLSDSVQLTLGARLESNVYSDVEFLPSARIAWKPSSSNLVWGAVSRAVRAPARLDRDLRFPPNGLLIAGGPYFTAEVANVIEVGYRAQPHQSFTYSLTAFHNDYDKLRSGQRPPPAAFIENRIYGIANGVEGWATFQPTRSVRLSGGFTTLRKHLALEPGSTDPTGPSALGNDPDQQWMLRYSQDLTDRLELDVLARRIGSLPQPMVPAYTAVDARLGWRVSREVELSVTLENLLDRSHPEFGTAPGRSEYERGAYLKLLWRM